MDFYGLKTNKHILHVRARVSFKALVAVINNWIVTTMQGLQSMSRSLIYTTAVNNCPTFRNISRISYFCKQGDACSLLQFGLNSCEGVLSNSFLHIIYCMGRKRQQSKVDYNGCGKTKQTHVMHRNARACAYPHARTKTI